MRAAASGGSVAVMPPPRASFAESTPQDPAQIAASIEAFFASHAAAVVLEDGKVLFDLRSAKYSLSTEHGRCTLHLWSDERNTVRNVVSLAERAGSLRLATRKFGQAQTRLLELVTDRERRTPSTRETARTRYLATLERVLLRTFLDWKGEGFRTAMDLERSFGPAYARGTLTRGQQAWAVIAVNEQESATTVDGILTLGVLWLDHCREHAGGRRLFQGLRVILPLGMAATTQARMAWMNPQAAQWELYELDQKSEELTSRDLDDSGNLNTRLIHHPDEAAAHQRFAKAIASVLALVPAHEHPRVERRLRNSAEMAFLLHGLEFARARLGFTGNTFAPRLEITVGAGEHETPLTPDTHPQLAEVVAELFRRRKASTADKARDPLYRAAPERWLESVLRRDLSPLTRHLAPAPRARALQGKHSYANDPDPETFGNRITPPPLASRPEAESRVIPRLDPDHVYTQVPAIAGAKDRGMLDLLGVTADGRLAVIELKADDDLHLALQGLDYWIRVRHHHLRSSDAQTGPGEFQRHGYFRGLELSPLPPRLYLVAPALRIHPATELVLRYVSPKVEWHLFAIDERWRETIRVIWRKQSER